MTVAELIERLSSCPQDAKVVVMSWTNMDTLDGDLLTADKIAVEQMLFCEETKEFRHIDDKDTYGRLRNEGGQRVQCVVFC